MDSNEQEAIENDPILKKLGRSKARQASAFLRNISSCLLDPNLLASQAFCLFLYGSCGAVLPYLPLYFKQFGLKPYQVGIIVGIAPIIQCLISPIWSVIANKWHVQKMVFLTGVLSFVVKLLLILAVQPRKQYCIESYVNSTTNLTYMRTLSLSDAIKNEANTKWEEIAVKPTVAKLSIKTTPKPTTTPANLKNASLENNTSRDTINPFSSLYGKEKKEELVSFVDGKGLQVLPLEKDESRLEKNPQDANVPHPPLAAPIKNNLRVSQARKETSGISKVAQQFHTSLNETVQYVIRVDTYELHDLFLIFMMFVLICDFLQAPTFALGNGSVLSRVDRDYKLNPSKMRFTGSIGWITAVLVVGAIVSKSLFPLCGSSRLSYEVAFYFSMGFVCMAFINALWFEYIYDQNTDNGVETWKNSFKAFFDLKGTTFFIGLIYISLCSGFLCPFLNWYIDDLRGSTLAIATVCATRELMVLLFYIIGKSFVSVLGRINVIILSLMSYAVCFFCYWLIQNPIWVVVGVVAVEGAAFGLVWRSCEKCINHQNVAPEVSSIRKGFLDALFWGIGNGGGALIGGALYSWIGGRDTFLTFGIVTMVMLLVLTIIQMCRSKTEDDEEEEQRPLSQVSGDETTEDEK